MRIGVEGSNRLLRTGTHELVRRVAILDPDHCAGMDVASIKIANVEVALDEVVRAGEGIRALIENDLGEVTEQEPDLIRIGAVEVHHHLRSTGRDTIPLLGVGRSRAGLRGGLLPQGVGMDRSILFDTLGIQRIPEQRDVLVHVRVPVRTVVDTRIRVVEGSEALYDMVLIIIARRVLPDEDPMPVVVVGDVVLECPHSPVIRRPFVRRGVCTRGPVHTNDHGVGDRQVLTTSKRDSC